MPFLKMLPILISAVFLDTNRNYSILLNVALRGLLLNRWSLTFRQNSWKGKMYIREANSI